MAPELLNAIILYSARVRSRKQPLNKALTEPLKELSKASLSTRQNGC